MPRLHPRALDALRQTLQSHIDAGRLPGAVGAIAQGGHVQWLAALGKRDAASGDAMREDAIFRIYSMTKPIVSLMALMLVEEGRLQLSDPIAQHLPVFGDLTVFVDDGPRKPQRAPTVHDLLRHTAGLTYEFLGNGPVHQQYIAAQVNDRALSAAAFCEKLAALPLMAQPGSTWAYSRATDVLGAVIEAVAGTDLATLLQQRIFAPLKMVDTAFVVPPAHHHRIAQPFARCPDTGNAVTMIDPTAAPGHASGGGGLMSTTADYIRFLQLMLNRGTLDGQRLVSRKTIEWMTADHLGDIPSQGELLPPGHGFGLGFAVRKDDGLSAMPGSAGMYYWSGIGGTVFFVDPAEDLFAVLMTQAPNQRLYYRALFRQMVYAAID